MVDMNLRNRDTDIENKCMDNEGKQGGGRMNGEIGIDMCTLLMYKTDN